MSIVVTNVESRCFLTFEMHLVCIVLCKVLHTQCTGRMSEGGGEFIQIKQCQRAGQELSADTSIY